MTSNNNGVEHQRTPSENQQHLVAIAKGIPDPLFILKCIRNRKGQITDFVFSMANGPGQKLLSRQQEEIAGRKLSELLPASYSKELFQSNLMDKYAQVLEKQQALEEETILELPSAKNVRFRQRITPFEDGVMAVLQPLTPQQPDQESLENTDAAFRELADQLTEAFFALNTQLQVTHWNKAAEKLFHLTAQKTVGKQVWEVFPEWKGSSVERLYQGSLRTKRPQVIVSEFAKKGNALLFTEIRVHPAQNGLHVFIKDITQRKRSEEALKVSKAHLNQILSTVDEVVFSYRVLTDGDFVYDYFSSATTLLWGYTPEELIENKYLLVSCLPAEYQEAFTQALLDQVLSNEAVTAEYPFRHRDGSTRWILTKLIPHRNPDGVLIVTGIAVDVTHRKKTSEQIQSANEVLEERVVMRTEALEGLINAIPDPIYVVEKAGLRISYCNGIFAQSQGFESREEIQGRSVAECFSPAETERFQQYSKLVFEGGQILHEHETLELKAGLRHFDAFKVPLRNKSGEIYALLGISHDITELINARQALSKQTGQLETTNKELEAFSYSVSHDLRAPLRAIDGYTRILLEDYGDRIDNEGKRIINVITSNAIKMGQLIDNLLDFSRLGRKELVRLDIQTNNLVESLLPELQSQIGDRQLTFNVRPMQVSTGDVNMLKQVWINLLSNAVKYTRNQAHAIVEVGSTPTGSENVFYVKDNGVGFDMQYSDKLFGVFQRLHTEEEFEGTGVGLAIAQRIVARHGGRIWAEGEPNKGATFFFSLPAKHS
jgi:PAS domain S-box-containing protein